MTVRSFLLPKNILNQVCPGFIWNSAVGLLKISKSKMFWKMFTIHIINKNWKIPRRFLTSFILECPVELFISPRVFSHTKSVVNGKDTRDNALVQLFYWCIINLYLLVCLGLKFRNGANILYLHSFCLVHAPWKETLGMNSNGKLCFGTDSPFFHVDTDLDKQFLLFSSQSISSKFYLYLPM